MAMSRFRLDNLGSLPEVEVPLYYEVWNWEGDTSVLPIKWYEAIRKSYVKQLWSEWNPERLEAEYVQRRDFDPSNFFFLTQRGNVGACCFAGNGEQDDAGTIEWLCVDPSCIRDKVGKCVMTLAARRLRDLGRTSCVVSVPATRQDLVEDLLSLGFVAV
eukprot:GILK01011105.1.p1 GENE.GILK01011105.1~~GILK01011105.1.p1  ORF type:complete len:174 (-),score=19.59 GILK01011105.1:60-536(-)